MGIGLLDKELFHSWRPQVEGEGERGEREKIAEGYSTYGT